MGLNPEEARLYLPIRLLGRLPQGLQKSPRLRVVPNNRLAPVSAIYHMINHARTLNAYFPSHDRGRLRPTQNLSMAKKRHLYGNALFEFVAAHRAVSSLVVADDLLCFTAPVQLDTPSSLGWLLSDR